MSAHMMRLSLHTCIRMHMMVTDLVTERQEHCGNFPKGTYQLSMRLIAIIHTLHCLLVGIVCGLVVLLLISVMLAIIYCVYQQRGKFTSGGGMRSNVNPLYQPRGGGAMWSYIMR